MGLGASGDPWVPSGAEAPIQILGGAQKVQAGGGQPVYHVTEESKTWTRWMACPGPLPAGKAAAGTSHIPASHLPLGWSEPPQHPWELRSGRREHPHASLHRWESSVQASQEACSEEELFPDLLPPSPQRWRQG